MRVLYFLCLLSFFLHANEEEVLHRIEAHLLIEDGYSALKEARNYLEKHPDSKKIWEGYIRTLTALHQEGEAIQTWKQFHKSFSQKTSQDLLEEISWAVLYRGASSTQYAIRLASLISAYKTKDARAIPIFLKMMKDQHAILRSVAIQLACEFLDEPLQKQILNSLQHEKIWIVRVELIKAVGRMRIRDKQEMLKQILEDERATAEEKQAATEAILTIYEEIDLKEIKKLATSSRASLRVLACDVTLFFRRMDAKSALLPLLQDARADVKIAAMKAVGYLFANSQSKPIIKRLEKLLEDLDPNVAITANWALLLIQPEYGFEKMKKWLDSPVPENRRVAAAAIGSCGVKGLHFAKKMLHLTKDPYVKVNLALALIYLRESTKQCCDILYQFLKDEKRHWMIASIGNTPFQVLAPSEIRHVDQIPNYPEAIDQMTRLSLLSILAILEDPRAKEAIQSFLLEKKWGVTGFAATTLLKEGGEESLEIVKELLQAKHPKVRLQASLVLAMYGRDTSAISHLKKAYDEVDHTTKLYILEAIGYISDTKSLPFLIRALSEPFQMRRILAACAILQCMYH